MVYLIGAGCGDPDLITIKGKEILSKADCIIYDRLISPCLLEGIKDTCECIYVGKENHHHTMVQDDINQLIVDKAKEHNIVVRLKGGDNYVFGRGGEEGIFLYEHRIPFQVIPGIPSFIGALAYNGIPITHRGFTSGIRIVTAHHQKNGQSFIDYDSLAHTNDTCVFMMGLSKLEEIVHSLLQSGKDENTPIALIYKGTFKDQKMLVSTLKNILEDFKKDPLTAPSLIIVGDVISCHEKLDFQQWTKEIAFPRVSRESSKLTENLQLAGYQVNEYLVGDCIPQDTHFPDLNQYTHIVFSSKFGVRCFFELCQKNKIDHRKLSHLKFCVIGHSTGNECTQYGIYPDYCPDYYTSEDLIHLLKASLDPDSSILICKGYGYCEKWKPLEEAFSVDYFDVYENKDLNSECLISERAIVFTCSSAVERTCIKPLPENILIFSIGPKTSETLIKHGYTNFIQSSQADFQSLLETIERNYTICIEQED